MILKFAELFGHELQILSLFGAPYLASNLPAREVFLSETMVTSANTTAAPKASHVPVSGQIDRVIFIKQPPPMLTSENDDRMQFLLRPLKEDKLPPERTASLVVEVLRCQADKTVA